MDNFRTNKHGVIHKVISRCGGIFEFFNIEAGNCHFCFPTYSGNLGGICFTE